MTANELWTRESRYRLQAQEYIDWMQHQRLDLGDAEAHLDDENLTQEQRKWLRTFVLRWDAITK